MAYLWSFAFLAAVPLALGYPSGAPVGACGHLTPGHRANQTVISPQAGPSPYTISVSKNTYSPSEEIRVSVTGESFKGILLQARLSDNTVVGTFSNPPTDTKLIRCTNDGDSVTHTNTNSKSAGTSFTWTAPPNNDAGNVTFAATVLQEYEIFWVQLASQQVTATDSSGAPWVAVNSGLMISLLCLVFAVTKQ